MLYSLLILIGILVYEKIWRKHKCKRIISNRISQDGGHSISIERLTERAEIYSVHYVKDNITYNKTVKFSFFYSEDWY